MNALIVYLLLTLSRIRPPSLIVQLFNVWLNVQMEHMQAIISAHNVIKIVLPVYLQHGVQTVR